jgi:hypothetical protein
MYRRRLHLELHGQMNSALIQVSQLLIRSLALGCTVYAKTSPHQNSTQLGNVLTPHRLTWTAVFLMLGA